MGWSLVHAYRTAHILPVLANGTADTGYNVNAVGTLDLNRRFRATGNPVTFTWDRSAPSVGDQWAMNGILILGHNLKDLSRTVDVDADDDSGFASVTSLVSADAPATDGYYFKTFTANEERYVRVDLNGANDTVEVGLVALVTYTDIGEPQLPGSSFGASTFAPGGMPAPRGNVMFGTFGFGGYTLSRTFTKLSTATVHTIMRDYRAHYIPPEGATAGNYSVGTIDGVGGGGGSNPLALVDSAGRVYYGRMTLRAREYAPGTWELSVDVEDWPVDLIGR